MLIEQSKFARPKENAPHEQGIIKFGGPGRNLENNLSAI